MWSPHRLSDLGVHADSALFTSTSRTCGQVRKQPHDLEEGLEALARYAPIFEARGFAWGACRVLPVEMTWMEHGDVASSFMDDAYKFGWVSGDFDWPAWSKTPEAIGLRGDPGAIEAAGADQLVKLLTCSIRAERFCDGTLAADYDSGLLGRIASRAQALASMS